VAGLCDVVSVALHAKTGSGLRIARCSVIGLSCAPNLGVPQTGCAATAHGPKRHCCEKHVRAARNTTVFLTILNARI
jgi:hypothetical protein